MRPDSTFVAGKRCRLFQRAVQSDDATYPSFNSVIILLFTQNANTWNLGIASFNHRPESFANECGDVLKSVQTNIFHHH